MNYGKNVIFFFNKISAKNCVVFSVIYIISFFFRLIVERCVHRFVFVLFL